MEIPKEIASHFSQWQLSKIGAAVTVACDATRNPWWRIRTFAPV
jgi:hypothetical protein